LINTLIQFFYGALNPMADGIYIVCQRIAYALFTIALVAGVLQRHQGANPKQLLLLFASLFVAIVCVTLMPDLLKHPDGLMWEIGDGVSDAVKKSNLNAYASFSDEVRSNALPGTGWFYAALAKGWMNGMSNLTSALSALMRILQVGLITFGYAISPLFCAMATWSVTRNAAIKFFSTLVGFFLWGLVWRFVDAGALAIVGNANSTGPLALLTWNLTTLFILIGYALGPFFMTKLFTAGTSGLGHMAGHTGTHIATSSGRSAFGAIKNAVMKGLKTAATVGAGTAAAMATGGTSAVAQAGIKAGTTTAGVATKAATAAASSATGPVGVGETATAGKASITRTSPNTFTMGGSEHNGDPNNATDLNRAFNATTFSSSEKSAIRMAMSARNTPPPRDLKKEKNQQVTQEFPV
jgi:hypothetical protein